MVQENSEGHLEGKASSSVASVPLSASLSILDGLSDISAEALVLSLPCSGELPPPPPRGQTVEERVPEEFFRVPVKVEVQSDPEEDSMVKMNRKPPPPPPFSVNGNGSLYISKVKNNMTKGISGSSISRNLKVSPTAKLPVTMSSEFDSGIELKFPRKLSPNSSRTHNSDGKKSHHGTTKQSNEMSRPRSSVKEKSHHQKQLSSTTTSDNQQPCSSKRLKETQHIPTGTVSPDIVDLQLPFIAPTLQDLLRGLPEVPVRFLNNSEANRKKKLKPKNSSTSTNRTAVGQPLPLTFPINPPTPTFQSGNATNRRKSHGPSKFSPEQVEALRAVFSVKSRPQALDLLDLESATGLTRTQISSWFKKERQKEKNTPSKINGSPREASQQANQGTSRNLVNKEDGQDPTSTAQNDIRQSNERHGTPQNERSASQKSGEYRSSQFSSYTIPKKRKASLSSPTSCKSPKLQNLENRERRMRAAASVHAQVLKKCLDENKARVQTLILLYTKKSLDMKTILLKETVRLKEMSTKCSPFSSEQLKVMKHWREEFFKVLSINASEEKKQRLQCVQVSVIEIWHPIIVYGKLTRVKLEVAIEDFLMRSSKGAVDGVDGYTVPGILRYVEAHHL